KTSWSTPTVHRPMRAQRYCRRRHSPQARQGMRCAGRCRLPERTALDAVETKRPGPAIAFSACADAWLPRPRAAQPNLNTADTTPIPTEYKRIDQTRYGYAHGRRCEQCVVFMRTGLTAKDGYQ